MAEECFVWIVLVVMTFRAGREADMMRKDHTTRKRSKLLLWQFSLITA